jgi:uncharacterized membrane protein YhiD involved in acid resistance
MIPAVLLKTRRYAAPERDLYCPDIGFLGAGVIPREGVTVRGINTAATIWCSAAVGVLAGAGYIPAAAVAAGLVRTAHLLLRPVARRVDRRPRARRPRSRRSAPSVPSSAPRTRRTFEPSWSRP